MSKYTEVFDSKEILMQITDDEYTHCLNKAKSDLEAHQKKQLNSDYKLQHIEYRQSQLQSRIIGVCAEYAFKKHYKMINDDFFCQLFDEGYDISLKKLRKYLEKYKKANKEQIIKDSLNRYGTSRNKVGTVVLGLLIASTLSACSMAGSMSVLSNLPDHMQYGNEQGIQAQSDREQGLITNGKASPDIETSYYKLRRDQNLGKIEIAKHRYGNNNNIQRGK